MRIINDVKLDFKDVLIVPKISDLTSRKEVDLVREYKFKYSPHPYKGIPILAANMDTVGSIAMAKAFYPFQMGVCLHKFISLDDLYTHFSSEFSKYSWYSMGITENDISKWQKLLSMFEGNKEKKPKNVVIDVANGYQTQFVDFVKRFRNEYPTLTIMVGNVCTAEMTETLILAGADVIKVGIGSGSGCWTRKQTGVGYPQLSSILETADSAHGLKGLVCSDGGITVPGDVCKAFGGGSDFVMCGGIFSAHTECEGEVVEKDGQKFMKFYGMSSEEAQIKHYGKLDTYKASEGKSVLVPYRGPVENTIQEILGGVRSALTYTGSRTLKELSKRTTFVRVTQQLNEVFGNS